MEEKIVSGQDALECAANIRSIGKKWRDQILPELQSAINTLNSGVNANIQVAFSEVFNNKKEAFELFANLMETMPKTIEQAVDDISSADQQLANQIRQKYDVK